MAAKQSVAESYQFKSTGRSHGVGTLQVPSSSVGLIIGTKGKQIRKIEEEAKLERYSINISRNESKPDMQTVNIKGQKANCHAAKHKIEELVEISMKRKHHDYREVRHTQVSGRLHKYLSFLTFLKGTDEIVFKNYKGMCPVNWEGDNSNLYFLEAAEQISSMPQLEDQVLHHRLRNYNRLQETLHSAVAECLRSPVYLELEVRFGKVIWRSDSQRTVSDEVLSGRHKIMDLEKGGKVSVEDVLGGKSTRWSFPTILSDATILESVKDADFPVIGDADKLDITMRYQRGSLDQEYMIRIKQNTEKKTFECLEVLVKPDKPYVFDCLNLERDLDMRVAIKCSPDTDAQAVATMNELAEELCQGMALRDGCLCMKEPTGECIIEYARWAKQTLYLVSHVDKVHVRECQYILAHYEVKDCVQPQYCRSAAGGKEVQLRFKDEHHELELKNCQWMADFAVLAGKTPEEVFALNCCDPSKIKVRPKDKSEVTAASVIRELDPFVACALELALIDRE